MEKNAQILAAALLCLIILASGCTQQSGSANANTTPPSFPNASAAKPPAMPEPTANANVSSQPVLPNTTQVQEAPYQIKGKILKTGENVTVGNYTVELNDISFQECNNCVQVERLIVFTVYGKDGKILLSKKKITKGTSESYSINDDVLSIELFEAILHPSLAIRWADVNISLQTNPAQDSSQSNGTFELHVGDNVTIGNYTVQLSDIGFPDPVTHGYPAVLSIYDKNGNLLTQQQAFPLYDEYGNQITENTDDQIVMPQLNGGVLAIKVIETQPGYTLHSKWADIEVISASKLSYNVSDTYTGCNYDETEFYNGVNYSAEFASAIPEYGCETGCSVQNCTLDLGNCHSRSDNHVLYLKLLGEDWVLQSMIPGQNLVLSRPYGQEIAHPSENHTLDLTATGAYELHFSKYLYDTTDGPFCKDIEVPIDIYNGDEKIGSLNFSVGDTKSWTGPNGLTYSIKVYDIVPGYIIEARWVKFSVSLSSNLIELKQGSEINGWKVESIDWVDSNGDGKLDALKSITFTR